jgi:hypothetical protein
VEQRKDRGSNTPTLPLLAHIHRSAWKNTFLGRLEIPPAPGPKVRSFGHGERRREAREEVAVVLAIGHTLRAHEALTATPVRIDS